MRTKYKKIGIILLSVAVLTIILTFIANMVIERKIINAFKQLPESIQVQYAAIEASVWGGDLKLFSPYVQIMGETSKKTILELDINTFEIKDVGYWNYFVNDTFSIDAIVLDQVVAKYKHNKKVEDESYNSKGLEKIKKGLRINHIEIKNSDILITHIETDSTVLSIPELNVELNNVNINPKIAESKIPFHYDSFKINGKGLKWAVSDYDNLLADTFKFTEKEASLSELKIKTKYSRQQLSSMLKVERDHFDVAIDQVNLKALNFGEDESGKFLFESDQLILNQLKATIYRDKLVADDLTIKPLYSEMLRELDFNFGIDKLTVSNGEITYAEKVKAENPAGTLDFKNFNADISDLGNIYGDADTKINVNAEFMNHAPLEVDWSFRVNDSLDRFVFKADMGFFRAAEMDEFTVPNLNVDMKGELNQTYFTISGNPTLSRIDLKMKYDEFKVALLKDNGKEKKSFLSGIINLFVANDSEDEKNNFRYGQADQVERDQTKSIFNFVWLNVREGLRSAIAGDGEKED